MSVLTMTRGDTAEFQLSFLDVGGAPLDLTGVDLTFTAKTSVLAATAVIEKTNGDGITVDVDPTTGLATLLIEPADTETFTGIYNRLYWDVELVDGVDVFTPLNGTLNVYSDVTA